MGKYWIWAFTSRRRKISLSMVALMLGLMLLWTALASATVAPEKPGEAAKLSAKTIERETSRGTISVEVLKNDKWHSVGELIYDRSLKEKHLVVEATKNDGAQTKLRLIQHGGGAAHLDAVTLGGAAPTAIQGALDDFAERKIAKKDYDVIDIYQKTIELTFPPHRFNHTLKITARIEPQDISKTPFQFPTQNLFKEVNQEAKFYTYRLASPDNHSASDNKNSEPFFKVLCQTGSGHPSGFTYGWVRNDAEKLYVDLDFTPDNTRDGNKDYAQLHVKTQDGVKSFTISELNRRWGDPNFTYTNKVKYQHKTYRFEVPFKELGIEKVQHKAELQLAFSAYGTASPRRRGPIISTGRFHTVEIRADGKLWAWGDDTYGQLGNGSDPASSTPVQINTETDWIAVTAGTLYTIALKSDGTLWTWGINDSGQLGHGTSDGSAHPDPVQVTADLDGDTFPDSDWTAIAAANSTTFAVKSNGTLWAWGSNLYGALGIGQEDVDVSEALSPVQVLGVDWESVFTRGGHALALKSDGTLWVWGRNDEGQIGDGTTDYTTSPVAIDADGDTFADTDWTAAAGGNWYSVALKSDGTLWAWGSNANGQLGIGTSDTLPHPTPIKLEVDLVGDPQPDHDWTKIALGHSHTVALRSDGTLWTWGFNNEGQLGDGTTTTSLVPLSVDADGDTFADNDWTDVAASDGSHTIALKSDGTLWAWGNNSDGQLGDGFTISSSYPLEITDIGFGWVSGIAGENHTAGIKDDGTLWTWGNNSHGQLGVGDTSPRTLPVQVTTDTDWVSVVPRDTHTVALKSNGTLWAWGGNAYGQVGDGSKDNNRLAPEVVRIPPNPPDTDWVSFSVGYRHTAALKSNGTLWTWGRNQVGQLGLGASDDLDHPNPAKVGLDTDWSAISAGGVSQCRP